MVDRELCFGDRFTNYLVNEITEDTSGDSINNELALTPDERQLLVLDVTGEEFTQIFSAVMTGADLAFNAEAQQITWLVWKAAKGMTFCDWMAWCIENSGAVQQALLALNISQSTNTTGNPDEILPLSISEKNLLPTGYTCDPDHRYGMAVAIVEALNTAVHEVFEAIEVLTNPLELANELADNIPIGGLVSTASDIISWVQNSAFEAYELAWSDTVRDDLACDLFCAMLVDGECELTYEMILSIYKDIPGVTVPDWSDWLAWVQFVVTIPLTASEQVVKACSLLGLGAIMFGSRFGKFQLGLRSLETTIALAVDDENPDWDILCDVCPGAWYWEDDLTTGQQGFSINEGSYSPGNGFVTADIKPAAVWVRQVDIYKAYVSTDVSKMRMTFDVAWGDFTGVSFVEFIGTKPNGEFRQILDGSQGPSGTDLIFHFEPVQETTEGRFVVRVSMQATQAALNGSCTLTKVEWWGTGDNPFD